MSFLEVGVPCHQPPAGTATGTARQDFPGRVNPGKKNLPATLQVLCRHPFSHLLPQEGGKPRHGVGRQVPAKAQAGNGDRAGVRNDPRGPGSSPTAAPSHHTPLSVPAAPWSLLPAPGRWHAALCHRWLFFSTWCGSCHHPGIGDRRAKAGTRFLGRPGGSSLQNHSRPLSPRTLREVPRHLPRTGVSPTASGCTWGTGRDPNQWEARPALL